MQQNAVSLFVQYALFAERTAIYPRQVENEYLALGMCSEAAECLEVIDNRSRHPHFYRDLAKEIGDVQWYIARMCSHIGVTYSDVVREAKQRVNTVCEAIDALCNRLTVQAGLIAGKVKKQLRDGHLWTGEQLDEARRYIIECMVKMIVISHGVGEWFQLCGFGEYGSYEKLLEGNIEKLTSREQRGTLAGSGDNR